MWVPLLNFEKGPRVQLLNFEGGSLGHTFKPWLGSWFHLKTLREVPGPGSQDPEVPGAEVLVPLLHHAQ